MDSTQATYETLRVLPQEQKFTEYDIALLAEILTLAELRAAEAARKKGGMHGLLDLTSENCKLRAKARPCQPAQIRVSLMLCRLWVDHTPEAAQGL